MQRSQPVKGSHFTGNCCGGSSFSNEVLTFGRWVKKNFQGMPEIHQCGPVLVPTCQNSAAIYKSPTNHSQIAACCPQEITESPNLRGLFLQHESQPRRCAACAGRRTQDIAQCRAQRGGRAGRVVAELVELQTARPAVRCSLVPWSGRRVTGLVEGHVPLPLFGEWVLPHLQEYRTWPSI